MNVWTTTQHACMIVRKRIKESEERARAQISKWIHNANADSHSDELNKFHCMLLTLLICHHTTPPSTPIHILCIPCKQTDEAKQKREKTHTNWNKINASTKIIQNEMKWLGRRRRRGKENKKTCVFFVIYLYLLYIYQYKWNILYSSEYII